LFHIEILVKIFRGNSIAKTKISSFSDALSNYRHLIASKARYNHSVDSVPAPCTEKGS